MSIDFSKFNEPDVSINYDPAKYKCQRLVGIPLYSFETKVPVYTDIVQGYIGSCWFLSCLASYLRPGPDLDIRCKDLQDMIDLHIETPTLRLYRVYLSNSVFIVDDFVPKEYIVRMPTCIWPILFEKAMLSLMGVGKVKFDTDISGIKVCRDITISLGEMNTAAFGLKQLIGGKSTHRYLHSKDDFGDCHSDSGVITQITAQEMYSLYRSGHHLLTNTSLKTYKRPDFEEIKDPEIYNAVKKHCYTILDITYDSKKRTYIFTLYNPWGRKPIIDFDGMVHPHTCKDLKCTARAADSGIFTITWERFHQVFACVHHTI